MEVFMPPKVKITKDDVVKAALDLVRKAGEGAVNARSIAAALSCSTQPVFSHFATMDELQQAVLAAAYDHYLGFLKSEVDSGAYTPYKAMGRGYIRFATEERELFRLLFMRDRGGEDITPTPDFEASVDIIMAANGLSRERARLMHLEMWACVHGIATMMATSFLSLDEDLIGDMLTDVYLGVRERYKQKEGV
jgi:AcrR family transcriptional regulator